MLLEDGLPSLSLLLLSILWLLLVFPLFAGVSVGVKACVTVLIGYASTLRGVAKLELLSQVVCVCCVMNFLKSGTCPMLNA